MTIKRSLILLLLALNVPLFAEHQFDFAAAPLYEVPLGVTHIQGGMGAAVSLDWAFYTFSLEEFFPGRKIFTRKFALGLGAGGSFVNFSAVESPFNIFEGGLGPFVRWRPFERWTFRLDARPGIYQYRWKEDSNTRFMANFAMGTDFHLTPYISVCAQGGYTLRGFSSEQPLNALGMALGVRINLSEIMTGRARLQGEKTEQRRIFPVSFAWYGENPIAFVQITNSEPNAITGINLSFFMDNYMERPERFAVVPRLASGESITVPVTALFNEAMLSLTENVNANGQVQIQYHSLGARKETAFTVQMPIYHRNAMSWDDDRRASSFVSPHDPAARLFARRIAAIADRVSSDGQTPAAVQPGQNTRGIPQDGIPSNVRYAAALFEVLRLYGISYIIDPASSFVEMSENVSALDSLNYPYQTLNYRGGDCDDLSILFCSLLEVLGIETAFITIPGHIYMAFEVGGDTWAAGSSDIIAHKGRRWLPVEITIPQEGFTAAWRVGAREWRNAGAEGRIYPMHENWDIYPPVSVAESRLPNLPDEAAINAAIERQLRNLLTYK